MPLTRPVLAFVVILIGLTQVRFAEAQRSSGFTDTMARGYCASSAWPDPHVAYDREAVGAYFAVVVNKGWCQQNTLGDLHFLENGAELNELGRIKIRSIVTESPLFRRSLYVYRAETPEKTAARMAAVERLALQIAPDGLAVPVMETTAKPPTSHSMPFDMAIHRFYTTSPDIQLPKDNNSSSGSGSGGH